MAQLVNDHVTLVNTMSQETLDDGRRRRQVGVPPARIIDYAHADRRYGRQRARVASGGRKLR